MFCHDISEPVFFKAGHATCVMVLTYENSVQALLIDVNQELLSASHLLRGISRCKSSHTSPTAGYMWRSLHDLSAWKLVYFIIVTHEASACVLR